MCAWQRPKRPSTASRRPALGGDWRVTRGRAVAERRLAERWRRGPALSRRVFQVVRGGQEGGGAVTRA